MTHVPWHAAEHDVTFEEQHGIESAELVSVGIDIGTTTTHLMFSEMVARRQSDEHSSEFRVDEREVVYRSPILLTPYDDTGAIDAGEIEAFVDDVYGDAGYTADDVDTGSVIVTGEAARRRNAESIVDLFADRAGEFVCATAGPNLEALMAAHGSGAVDHSVDAGTTVLHLDVGGGTTKFARIVDGFVEETASLNVGTRLLAFDDHGRLTRIEDAARQIADSVGITLEDGQNVPREQRHRIASRMADLVFECVDGERTALADSLLVTEALDEQHHDVLSFSGGGAEYVHDRDPEYYGDLGAALGNAIADRLDARDAPVAQLDAGIRATAIGSTQHTVQVSGNTITITDGDLLPVQNVPIVPFVVDQADDLPDLVADMETKLDLYDVDLTRDGFAFGFHLHGTPTYDFLDRIARASIEAHGTIEGSHPLILAFESDVALNAGRIAQDRTAAPVVAVDGIDLDQFGYIDIGEPIAATESVPITVKSLLFEG